MILSQLPRICTSTLLLAKADPFYSVVPDWFIFHSFILLFSEPIRGFKIRDILRQGSPQFYYLWWEEIILFALNLYLLASFEDLSAPLSVRRMASDWPQFNVHAPHRYHHIFPDLTLFRSIVTEVSSYLWSTATLCWFSGLSSATNLPFRR